MQKLPRKISVVSYQGRYKEKGAKVKVVLNATIMLKLFR